jgi:hypothetical protein
MDSDTACPLLGKGNNSDNQQRKTFAWANGYYSISGHADPKVQLEALQHFPFDSVLCPASVLDHFIKSSAEESLPTANANGVAVVGMKIMGLGALSHIYEKTLRYTFGLPISTAILGMESLEQLKKNLYAAEYYQPLSDEERLDLFREVLPLVTPKTMPWKAGGAGTVGRSAEVVCMGYLPSWCKDQATPQCHPQTLCCVAVSDRRVHTYSCAGSEVAVLVRLLKEAV